MSETDTATLRALEERLAMPNASRAHLARAWLHDKIKIYTAETGRLPRHAKSRSQIDAVRDSGSVLIRAQ